MKLLTKFTSPCKIASKHLCYIISGMLSEFLVNLFTPLIISQVVGLSNYHTILVVFGVFLIDMDHLFYMIYDPKIKTPRNAISFIKIDLKKRNPHFYVFHTIEFLTLFLILSFYFFNNNLFYISVGFVLNFLLDILTYINHYKKPSPWLKYFSLIYYVYYKLVIQKRMSVQDRSS